MKINIGPYPEDNEERIVEVHIDNYDSWGADHTLALVILPVLKQLKETKHGSPHVDDEDVAEHLGIRSTQAAPKENEWDIDEHWHKRWEYVLDCMIWAFNEIVRGDWEDQFWTVKPEADFDRLFAEGTTEDDDERGNKELKWKVEGVLDREGLKQHEALIQQGLNLFGKYYRNLWD
jgi:hypothetical protein